MKQYSIFDIVGPDMIGPSSSHTAGAARISFMASKIFGLPIRNVVFELHGSFSKTYKGHGSDKALLAGILGIRHNDDRLREAYKIAEGRIDYTFVKVDLGDVHPNTVRITMTSEEGIVGIIQGSSIGGGNSVITKIDDIDVEIDGMYDTLITVHQDKPGMIARLSNVLLEENINIAFMKVYREIKGKNAIMVLETDELISRSSLENLKSVEGVFKTTYIPKGGN
jgi:L-serine dehydratase